MSRTKTRGRGRGRGGGRGWSGGRGRGGYGKGAQRDNRWDNPRSEITRTNEAFEGYYNRQNIVPKEEREQFWDAMKEDLPNSFRFAGSRGHALTVQRRLIDHYIPELTAVEFDGEPVQPPSPISWFPDKLAWEMKTPKKVIRKFPPFASFQKFLVSENNVGNITRQEIVSMIPPLLLDIKPGMTVLDLCAAPGSKSAQIIEMVHGGEEARVRKVLEDVAKKEGRQLAPEGFEVKAEKEQAEHEDDYADDGRSTGLLIANDVDYRRAQMLVHQCKRLNSPNLVVVNHDATLFPSIKIPSQSGNAYLKFDRILADVPCSGDGTTRKNTEIWKDWSPTKSLGLHLTQVRILVRSLQMLKVGGRVVYSTCSLNPIENEAVVASAIDRCGGSIKVKLLAKDDALPGLKRASGLKKWEVLDKTGEWWSSYQEMTRTREEKGLDAASKIIEGMFPPNESDNIPLEHCMRVYPHMQDTGGFFIAVLEKQSEIRARPENQAKSQSNSEPVAGSVMAVIDEIKDRPQNGDSDLTKLDAADAMDEEAAKAPEPVSHKPAEFDAPTNGRKRSLDGSNDDPDPTGEGASVKRLKTRNDEPHNDTLETSLDRTVHYPPPPSNEAPAVPTSTTTETISPTRGNQNKRANNTPAEESFIYLSSTHPELLEATSFYHLSPRFPTDRFMVRNPSGDPVKAIYYTSALAKQILESNVSTGIKFVHCGVKMFVKQDVSTLTNAGIGDKVSKWRIQSEGLPILEGWVGEERVVRVWRKSTLRKLLLEMFPKINGETGDDNSLGELKEQVQNLGPGCAVLRVEPRVNDSGLQSAEGNSDDGFTEHLTMPLWRGATSINLMLPKDERKAMLLRLYNDDSELVDNSKGAQQRQADKERKDAEKDGRRSNGQSRDRDAGAGSARGGRRRDPNYEGPGPGGRDDARVKAEDEDAMPTLQEIQDADSAPESEDGGMDLKDEQDVHGGVKLEEDDGMTEADVARAGDVADAAQNGVVARKQDEEEKRGEMVAPGVRDEDASVNRTV